MMSEDPVDSDGIGHTAKRMRPDSAAEEQKQLQVPVPDEEPPPPDGEPSPCQRLPDELLVFVFSHLSPRELCASVLPVCRRWRELGRDPVLWQHLSFDEHDCPSSTVVTILSFSTRLTTLTLSKWWWHFDKILCQVADTCPQLRSLTIKDCGHLGLMVLEAIVEKCPLIERVDIEGTPFDHDTCISALTGLQHLKALGLCYCEPPNEDALVRIVRRCTRLQELKVGDMGWLTDHSVQELVSRAGGRLLSLELNGGNLTDAGYTALGRCRKLQTLRVEFGHRMTDVSLPALAGLHGLTRLQIQDGRKLRANALARLFAGQNMPLLVELNLNGCCNVDDATLDLLTANCPQLTVLDLRACNSITNAGLELIFTRLRSLCELNLSYIMNVDDTTVDALTANCPQLTVLDLSGCDSFTDAGLMLIVTRLSHLRRLDLHGVTGITERLIPQRFRQPAR